MNTHIIIPIKDIRDRIKKLSEYPMTNQEAIYELEQILIYKQISLDEKDIEERANTYCKNNKLEKRLWFFIKKNYKQALLDILK